MMAAISNSLNTAKFLIKKGADTNAQDHNGQTALMIAQNNGYNKLEQLLKKNIVVVEEIPLRFIKTNKASKIKRFITGGADVNIKYAGGVTPLIAASKYKAYEIAKELIENGADVNGVDDVGWTALMYAAIDNSLKFCRLLLGYGADQELLNNSGRKAMDYTEDARILELFKTNKQ